MKFERNTEQYSSMIHINHKFTRHVIPARCLGNGIAVLLLVRNMKKDFKILFWITHPNK